MGNNGEGRAARKNPLANCCPACGTPFSVGVLGPGTAIEVKCKRVACQYHNEPFRVVVPTPK